MIRSHFTALLVVTVAVALPVVGAGEEPEEIEDEELESDEIEEEQDGGDMQRAQELFDAGAQRYYEGDFSAAAVEFRRAYEAYAHPLFLYNFALANWKLGQLENVVEAAREVAGMDVRLEPEQDARNEGLFYGGRTALGIEDRAEKIAEAREAESSGDGEESETEEEVADVEEPPEVQESEWGLLGWAGIGSLAVGLGSAVAGGVAHYYVRPHRQELEERRERSPTTDGIRELESEVASRELRRNLMLGSGIGLVALGTGLIVWESQRTASGEASAVRISVDGTTAGVRLRW